jgi:beta-glucosidase
VPALHGDLQRQVGRAEAHPHRVVVVDAEEVDRLADELQVAVADGVDALRNRIWLGPLVDGRYDDGVLDVAPVLADPDVVREGDLALVQGSADWLGINYYTPARVDLDAGTGGSTGTGAAGGDAGVEEFPGVTGFRFTPRPPLTDIGWEVEPRGLEELLVSTSERTGLPLVVTENGAAVVDDQDRIDYLAGHVAAVDRARAQGADVRGYVLWTLLDNFEWAEGYTKHFGVVAVDRDTLERTPKPSYQWYADLVAHRRGAGATP